MARTTLRELCQLRVLRSATANLVGGMFYGYVLGIVAVYVAVRNTSLSCGDYTTAAACLGTTTTDGLSTMCKWDALVPMGQCEFVTLCSGRDRAACDSDAQCTWQSGNGKAPHCGTRVGWSDVDHGLFAGAMITGGFIGSVATGLLGARWMSYRRGLLIAGIIAVAASAAAHAASFADSLPGLVAWRLCIGVSGGIVSVCAPRLVQETTPRELSEPVGATFHVSVVAGHLVAAIVGVAVNPSNMEKAPDVRIRLQMLVLVESITAVALVIMGLRMCQLQSHHRGAGSTATEAHTVCCEPPPVSASISANSTPAVVNDERQALISPSSPNIVESCDDPQRLPVRSLVIAAVLACANQMTGVNAVVNFGPQITSSVGIPPLLGNLAICVLNLLMTVLSIPVATRMPMVRMNIISTFVASLGCLLVGVCILPQVVDGNSFGAVGAKVVAGFGLTLFVMGFQVGMGPPFYVLAQTLFAPAFRTSGSSYTLSLQFLFNIIVSTTFPIAVSRLSGSSGNSNEGMGVTFLFFGSVGVLCGVFLKAVLR